MRLPLRQLSDRNDAVQQGFHLYFERWNPSEPATRSHFFLPDFNLKKEYIFLRTISIRSIKMAWGFLYILGEFIGFERNDLN
jgi:hypothetical protein